MMDVYEQSEDSFLLLETLQRELDNKLVDEDRVALLDMGAGSGYLGFEAYKKQGVDVTLVDNNPEAVSHMKHIAASDELSVDIIQSDLFNNLSGRKFDIIVFNTPYLPYDESKDGIFDRSIHGGCDGNEVTLRFISQAGSYLAEDGVMLLLFSSLSQPQTIISTAEKHGFACHNMASQHFFFEKLYVYKLLRR